MLKKNILLVFLLVTFVYGSLAQQRMVMIGGGKRPPDVLGKISELSGGDAGKLLVITWATEQPEVSFEAFQKDIATVSRIRLVKAPFRPLTEQSKTEFLQQLKEATGLFFTGGDQNKIMEVLQDETLFKALREKYDGGALFSGTSAGTAIMSGVMITGEGDFTVIDGSRVETRRGLGLLNEIIVDQHFIKRSRHNRLIGLVLQNPNLLGVGIDEDTALLVKDNRHGEVLGSSRIMFIDGRKTNEPMRVFLLKKGDQIDLKSRKKTNGK